MASRKVVYDDQDLNSTQYEGRWFATISAEENVGNFGQPYLNTLHGTHHDAKIFFEFNGTDIGVYGTNIVVNSSTDPDPNFECFVDGISIGRELPFEFPENNWKLCGKGGFSAGPHKLEIDIKVQSHHQTFWLDQIRYIPSPGMPLDDKMILVANTDPAIRLDDSWHSLGEFNGTSKTNATAQVDFIGTSVAWVGYIPQELPHGSASGTYSIDDGEPVNFNLAGLPIDEQNSQYNQVFFATQEVNTGPHRLTVTFLGSDSTTPLTLGRLYINNGSSTAFSGTPSITSTIPGPTTVTSATTDLGKQPGPNIDAILGGIIGVLGLLIIIAGAVLCRRHRRLSRETLGPAFGVEHTPRHINPYREFQINASTHDVPTTPILPPMKIQETYTHGPIQSSPVNSLTAKWREAFGSVRQSSHSRPDSF